MNKTKTCTKCGETASVSKRFYVCKKNKDGFSNVCAICKAVRKYNLRWNPEPSLTFEDVKALLIKNDYKCAYCSVETKAGLSHKDPPSKGGKTDIDNLTTICYSCSIKKGAKTETEFKSQTQQETTHTH
jgi:5-methylcytosine-specific restriction endonuclease McrA